MTKRKHRPQAQKNLDLYTQRILDLRRGSRTSRIPSGKTYTRKLKYQEW